MRGRRAYEYTSGLATTISEYVAFREGLGFSDEHARRLVGFDRFCTECRPQSTTLDKETVRGWFDRELRSGAKDLAGKACAIRCLARHVGGDAYVLPMSSVPKSPAFKPYIMDDDELRRFFEALDSLWLGWDPFLNIALRVMVRLIYACGLRPGEAMRLKVGAVDFPTGVMLIEQSKGLKDRYVTAADDVAELLRTYRERRAIVAGDGPGELLFVRTDGSEIESDHLRRHVRRAWAAANPGTPADELPRLRPYDLRHRFASEVLQRWIDEGRNLYAMLPYLRSYMGHVRFEDTAYYIHLLPDRLVKSPGVDWGDIDGVGLGAGIWED